MEESSALLFSHRERTFGLEDVNHLTMCKFSDSEDVNYRRIKNRIRAEHANRVGEQEQIEKLRAWINGMNEINHAEHRDNMKKRHPGTCDDRVEFQDWIASQTTNSVLWVYATAGAGKTVLTSAAVEYVQSLPGKPVASFIFLKFDLHLSKLQLLKDLASQFLDLLIKQETLSTDPLRDQLQFSSKESTNVENLIE